MPKLESKRASVKWSTARQGLNRLEDQKNLGHKSTVSTNDRKIIDDTD
jgi:hypothetical protein